MLDGKGRGVGLTFSLNKLIEVGEGRKVIRLRVRKNKREAFPGT